MPGPIRPAREDSGEVLTLRPIGSDGVDLSTDVTALPPTVLGRAENVIFVDGTADRRPGAIKLAQAVDPTTAGKSYTFAATTKYATFTPPLIPAGGFAVVLHFNAVRPSAGNTGWIVGARPAGQLFHVVKATIDENGLLTVAWTDSGGSSRSVTTSALTANADVHVLAIYDAVAGTYTVYVNGASSGTPLTGLAATLKPDQTASVVWTFGVEKETGQAVTANSHFSGKTDGMTIFTLRGLRPASGTVTLAEVLRRHSARAWPNPAQDFVLAHYDMDETSGTVMYDHSNNQNHGTYVGTPTVSDPVALLSSPSNMVGRIEVPSGKFNLFGTFGRLFYERTSPAVT